MKVKKVEKIKIELTLDEALKIRNEFGKLKGVTDDMVITEFMEHLDIII